jgi:hypothetical protein
MHLPLLNLPLMRSAQRAAEPSFDGAVSPVPAEQPDNSSPVRDLARRRNELESALAQQERVTHRLAIDLDSATFRLSTVRERERRRAAVEILALSADRLGELNRLTTVVTLDVADGRYPHSESIAGLRTLIDGLLADFRILVRGIQPRVR